MLVVVERSPRRGRVVLGLLEAFLELPVEHLGLLGLGLHLLPEALLALRRPRVEGSQRRAQIGQGPLARRLLVGDDDLELGIDRQFGFAARAGNNERRRSHGVTLAGRLGTRKPSASTKSDARRPGSGRRMLPIVKGV